MIVPDFKIRTNLKNINNSFRKTKSGAGVKVEKNRAREERYGKSKTLTFLRIVSQFFFVGLLAHLVHQKKRDDCSLDTNRTTINCCWDKKVIPKRLRANKED